MHSNDATAQLAGWLAELLDASQVARRLGVSSEYVRTLTRAGRLRAFTTGSGRRLYRPIDVDALGAELAAARAARGGK